MSEPRDFIVTLRPRTGDQASISKHVHALDAEEAVKRASVLFGAIVEFGAVPAHTLYVRDVRLVVTYDEGEELTRDVWLADVCPAVDVPTHIGPNGRFVYAGEVAR